MLRTMFTKGALPVVEKVLAFTEHRNKVLAHNVANIDTPYYKAQDYDTDGFDQMLQRALQDRARGNPRFFPISGSRNLQLVGLGTFDTTLRERALKVNDINILAHDNNKRSIEVEMAELTKNAGRHNRAAAFLVKQYGQIRAAISERVT